MERKTKSYSGKKYTERPHNHTKSDTQVHTKSKTKPWKHRRKSKRKYTHTQTHIHTNNHIKSKTYADTRSQTHRHGDTERQKRLKHTESKPHERTSKPNRKEENIQIPTKLLKVTHTGTQIIRYFFLTVKTVLKGQ